MTFDLSSEHLALRDAARAFARERLAAAAPSIDASGEAPADLAREAVALVGRAGDALGAAIVVEELAAVSASVAAIAAVGAGRTDRPGLRGARSVPADDLDARSRVLVSAVALGIGRAALDASLDVFKAGSDRPSGLADERPHWLLADAATEMDAARLLVWRGAQTLDGNPASTPDVALAHTLAVGAAERTVAAALRIGGPDRYTRDGLLDRLSRDVRTVAFLGGTEEEHRLLAGQIFPQ